MLENPPISCPDEMLLASYLSGAISDELRSVLEGHFSECQYCCDILVDCVRVAHRKSAEVEDRPDLWQRVLARRVSPSASNVVRFYPRHQPMTPITAPRALAADTGGEGDIDAFVSEDGSILLRSLRQAWSGQVRLYLIGEDVPWLGESILVISNPKVGFYYEGRPDVKGCLIVEDAPALSPADTSVVLFHGDAHFHLQPRALHDSLVAEGAVTITSRQGYKLIVSLIETAAGRRYRLDLSDMTTRHPKCSLRAYVSHGSREELISVDAGGIGWVSDEDTEAREFSLTAYVVGVAS
ncbi:hypothetical protein JXA88_08105 [Candidatus Fermentibacteria bacterium]|nr:hypothetical protein [Candidatus Fermentibacteria bacterium]